MHRLPTSCKNRPLNPSPFPTQSQTEVSTPRPTEVQQTTTVRLSPPCSPCPIYYPPFQYLIPILGRYLRSAFSPATSCPSWAGWVHWRSCSCCCCCCSRWVPATGSWLSSHPTWWAAARAPCTSHSSCRQESEGCCFHCCCCCCHPRGP